MVVFPCTIQAKKAVKVPFRNLQRDIVECHEIAEPPRKPDRLDGIVYGRAHLVCFQRRKAAPKHMRGRIAEAMPIS